MTTDLCMNEIKNCQRLSVGPNFVTFLGQKYGYRPIPTNIEGQEFAKLCSALNELKITEVDLLYTWYREDKNAIPSTFILQPISSILLHFNNKKEPELMAKDQATWWQTLSQLQKILRLAACHLFDNKQMTEEEKHNYIMAVTEREVINGVLKLKETRNTCIGYIRHIQKINMSNVRTVNKFIDLIDGEVDKEAAELLSDLRDNRLVKKIHPDNIIKYKLDWSDLDGLNERAHYDYLCEFINHFYKNIVKLVRRAMRKEDSSNFGRIVNEILQHSHSCNAVSRIFLGRVDELQTIREYCCGSNEDRFRRPLILHGAGGSGKTSLLAKAASLVKCWIGKEKCILVLRFMGTTPDSSSVIPALTSICQQLAYNYTLPMDQMPDDLIPLMFYYKQLLLNASYDQPLVIFLDSADQLDGPMVSLKLSWLTYELPENCKIVVSCVSEGDCEDYLFLKKALAKFESNFLAIPTLTKALAIDVITTMLRDVDRTLTDIQWTVVQKTLQCCTLPIFLKLVYARVTAWKSYTIATTLSLNVMDSITSLFDRVEIQHGKCLVSYALAYITASKCGLSESELEDLISLDDIVLNDIYQYHLPPIRRIPPLLWTRIRSDLPNYLTERDADGVSVMNWYHRQFREASIIRYLSDGDQVEYFHSMIADYFIGMWGGIEKPFHFSEVQKTRFGMMTDTGSADRKVPQQPNVYHAADGSVSRFNGRKFGELPFHLARSKRFEDLFQMVLFKYEWLHSKLSCCPLQSVLGDFEDCKTQLKKFEKVDAQSVKEVQLMIDAIKLAAAILIQYPSMLAPQILARLLPLRDQYPNIASLLKQCDDEGVNHCSLLPINHCLHTPGGPLMYSLEGHSFAVFDFILTSDNRYILSVSNKFLMWDLSTGEVSREVNPNARGIMQVLVITGDDKLALTFTNYNDVWALDILTGEVLFLDGAKLQFPSPILGIQVASDNRIAVVWCKESWATLFLYPKLRVNHIFQAAEELEEQAMICTMNYESCDLFHVTYFTEKGSSAYWLQTFVKGNKVKLYRFYSGIVITDRGIHSGTIDRNIAFSSLETETESWSEPKALPYLPTEESDTLLSLIESHREDFIVGVYLRGFKLYSVADKHFQPKYLTLPHGVRNISVQPLQVVSRLLFTKYNQYAVAGIRRSLYVWSVSDGRLMKIIDAHYGRIVEMLPLVVDDINAVATSSLDRTVKVWNIKNIFEQVHVIDRMELPVDQITFSAEMGVAAVVTRSCVGLWDLMTGRLKKTLAHSTIGAIVTHAVVSQNGNFLLSVESDHILVWDLRTDKLVIRKKFVQVKDLRIVPKCEQVVVTIEQELAEKYGTYVVKILDILTLDQKYEFQYFNRKKEKLRTPCITVSGQLIVLPDIEIPECVRERDTDTLKIHETSNGRLLKTVQLGNFTDLIATMFKGNGSVIGVLSPGSGQILDVSTNRILAKVPRWNSACTRDGNLGLCASARSGLEVVELRHGSAVRVLLPKVTEGLVHFITGFTADDEYVYYYHGTKRTIRLFRVIDGEMVANYRLSTEAKVVTSSPDGKCLLVGGIDGSLVILIIADPEKAECRKLIETLPSRCLQEEEKVGKSPLVRWKGAVRMTKLASTNQTETRRLSADVDSVESQACSIS